MQPIQARDEVTANFLIDAVENVLAANCGQCHGPAPESGGAGGIDFIVAEAQLGRSRSVERLVQAGLIVPLSSATSRIIIVMEDGSMPPSSSGLPPVTEADIATVRDYIDIPFYWPGVAAPLAVDAGVAAPLADAGSDGG